MSATQTNGRDRLISLLSRTPLIGPTARAVRSSVIGRLLRKRRFRNSSAYWERRYIEGGTSGSGSYGRLAQFKAETLNAFVERTGIRSIIEFGCGDGAQLMLADYPSYVGVDVSPTSIRMCRDRFASDGTKRFVLAGEAPRDLGRFDLALSLDVIYHLVEDRVFDAYMRSLFANAERFVVVYSSNAAQPADSPHVRHREFTGWVERNEPHWRQVTMVRNKYPYDPARPDETSFADFYFFQRVAP
jgi:cyclopropane fatty-acyl-phospholipid synthase-like methyltransferase